MITIDDIRRVRPLVAEVAARTPLLPMDGRWLKLENLQPIGSFKIRGAHAQMTALRPKAALTASAGNMAQGVAYCARRMGISAHVVVPDTAPRTKLEAIERLGGRIIQVPFDRWWRTFEDRAFPGIEATYISAFDHPEMLAGNGTIGLEIVEDLPGVEAVLVPWGGGGLACGIAIAVKTLKPAAKVYAVEVETGAPLAASWAAGKPVKIEFKRSFVDGIGAPMVFPHMYDLARKWLDGVKVVSLDAIKAAVRLLAVRARVIAEGAGAAPVAVEMPGRVACVVSGGNIDAPVLADILS